MNAVVRLIAFSLIALVCRAQDAFQLKAGDRVVFFGDSITDQRLYTTFVETYVLTRFPQRDVTFVHSGWDAGQPGPLSANSIPV